MAAGLLGDLTPFLYKVSESSYHCWYLLKLYSKFRKRGVSFVQATVSVYLFLLLWER